MSVDPLTKKYPMLSTYQYASNTPVWAIDIDGLEAGVLSVVMGINSEGKEYEISSSFSSIEDKSYIPNPDYKDKGILTIYTNIDNAEKSREVYSSIHVEVEPTKMQKIAKSYKNTPGDNSFFKGAYLLTTPVRSTQDYMRGVQTVSGGVKGSVRIENTEYAFRVGMYSTDSEKLGGFESSFVKTDFAEGKLKINDLNSSTIKAESPFSSSLKLFLNTSMNLKKETKGIQTSNSTTITNKIDAGVFSISQKNNGSKEFDMGFKAGTPSYSKKIGINKKSEFRSKKFE